MTSHAGLERIERDLVLLKWMVGTNVALTFGVWLCLLARSATLDRVEDPLEALRDLRHELEELTAEAGVLTLALRDVLDRLVVIDRLLARVERPVPQPTTHR